MIECLIPLILAVVAFVISIRSFLGKGAPVNNAYLFASPQERKTMDKTPIYRQSAIAFCLIGLLFTAFTLAVALQAWWLSYVGMALALATVVYAVASSAAQARSGDKGGAGHEQGH